MTIEIRKELKRGEVWYHVFQDNNFQRAFTRLIDAERFVEDIVDQIQNPATMETIKTITI